MKTLNEYFHNCYFWPFFSGRGCSSHGRAGKTKNPPKLEEILTISLNIKSIRNPKLKGRMFDRYGDRYCKFKPERIENDWLISYLQSHLHTRLSLFLHAQCNQSSQSTAVRTARVDWFASSLCAILEYFLSSTSVFWLRFSKFVLFNVLFFRNISPPKWTRVTHINATESTKRGESVDIWTKSLGMNQRYYAWWIDWHASSLCDFWAKFPISEITFENAKKTAFFLTKT